MSEEEIYNNMNIRFFNFGLALILVLFSFSIAVNAQKEVAINAVQGDGNISPYEGKIVRLEGIVTARIAKGFFIQTPDAKIDDNPKTSEGIYVFTGREATSEATIGNLVSVTGEVQEYRYKTALSSLTLTELSMRRNEDTIRVVSKENALPKPVTLKVDDFKSNDFAELERFEGMRVFVPELKAVSPTIGRVDTRNGSSVSNGTFFATLKEIPRTFREPGMDVHDFFSSDDKDKWKKDHPKLPIFDSNPEAIRIDSSAQLGAQIIDVTSGAEIKNLSGIMYYDYGKYTILTDVDTKANVSGFVKSVALPQPTERQISIAGMNLENYFDDEDDPSIKEEIVTREAFARKTKKISMAIREYLRFPDIIGISEAENLNALKKLAGKINDDAVAAKEPNPKYEAYLIDGNDGRGIDVGFLVKSARVKVLEVKQFGKDETYKEPKGKEEAILNDRPPMLLRASVDDPKTGKPFEFTAIINHLKSFYGYDEVKDGGLRVRTKKKLQAEYLAKIVQARQEANPNENIVLLGDFNFYQFSDGILDIIGTIKGTPAAKDEVLMASDDLVNPDLIDLADLIQADQRYSYTFDGNAQVLDHMLINQPMRKHLVGFGYARLNADFPAIYFNDENRVERFSDHDAAVGYFTFDERKTAAGK